MSWRGWRRRVRALLGVRQTWRRREWCSSRTRCRESSEERTEAAASLLPRPPLSASTAVLSKIALLLLLFLFHHWRCRREKIPETGQHLKWWSLPSLTPLPQCWIRLIELYGVCFGKIYRYGQTNWKIIIIPWDFNGGLARSDGNGNLLINDKDCILFICYLKRFPEAGNIKYLHTNKQTFLIKLKTEGVSLINFKK